MIRLWVLGSLAWIGYWTWNFAANCMRMDDGSLWCPAIAGESLMRSDRWHMASAIFGLPLLSLACGLACFWAIKASQRQIKSQRNRKN